MIQEFLVRKQQDFTPVIEFVLGTTVTEVAFVIALSGDLGAGKTAFTQELAKFLGVTEVVTSPTFTIMKQYPLEGQLFNQLVHIDAYRLEDESEVVPLRLQEIFNAPKTIVCLEWPERIAALIPSTAVRVSIGINPDETRTVRVELPERK
jgi:tRNA threonylcarbamoyladenosine biosynthesis protein TsaE